MDSPLQRVLPRQALPKVQPRKRQKQAKGGASFSLSKAQENPPDAADETPNKPARDAQRAGDGEPGNLLDITA